MQQQVKWIIAGVVGGVVGAAIWGAIGYFTDYESGWTALGVGIIVGVAVRLVTEGDTDRLSPGIIAAAIAALSILIAKCIVVSIVLSNAIAEELTIPEATPERMVDKYTWDIFKEQLSPDQEDAILKSEEGVDYPPEVIAKAQKQWQSLMPEEQKAAIADYQTFVDQEIDRISSKAREIAFTEAFTLWDVLWIGLAIFVAFKVGTGMGSDWSW